MIAKIFTAQAYGYTGKLIEVEADAKAGLPGLQIVGMGNKAIDEARDRVRSAITNSFLEVPAKKMTINLAPAELPKDGTSFDLPIALSILIISGQLKQKELANSLFAGELSLGGELRPIRGIINIVETAKQHGITTVYIPRANVRQASLVKDIEIIGVDLLKNLYLHLKGELKLTASAPSQPALTPNPRSGPIIDEVSGQEQAKRALTIAAAGRHNLLLNGPPGAGKTMLAKVLANLLPPLSDEEQIAVTKLYSLSGETTDDIIASRPFRAPHHTSSVTALVGGGAHPRPGEISLAHMGVLFLDELPEYPRIVIESLRQPLEDKQIAVARVNGRFVYPADFMLIATMNPCPCGYYGDPVHECRCNQGQIDAYQKRLSGPLLDRIDMQISVSRIPNELLVQTNNSLQNTQHTKLLDQIMATQKIQFDRYNSSSIYNANLSTSAIRRHVQLPPDVKVFLDAAAKKLSLSARAYFKVLRVAQTIADLEQARTLEITHISEALRYRTSPLSQRSA